MDKPKCTENQLDSLRFNLRVDGLIPTLSNSEYRGWLENALADAATLRELYKVSERPASDCPRCAVVTLPECPHCKVVPEVDEDCLVAHECSGARFLSIPEDWVSACKASLEGRGYSGTLNQGPVQTAFGMNAVEKDEA
jgi:hypothetical protein